MHKKTFKVVSSCSGINAVWVALLSLASYNLCHCFTAEQDEALGAFTSKTLGLNPDKNDGDVTTTAMKQLERVHVFQWSPPCIPFSYMGSNAGSEHVDSDLWTIGVRYIQEHKLLCWIYEMVPAITKFKHTANYLTLLKCLRRVGSSSCQNSDA